MKLAMIIDKRKCIGCLACTVACKAANGLQPGVFWTTTKIDEHGTFPNSRYEFMPLLCNHCDNAPCVNECPTGASMKLADGTVQINLDECIGCMTCMEVCPYGARVFNEPDAQQTYWSEVGKPDFYEQARFIEHKPETVEKCTFCARRRNEEGLAPACVTTCIAGARYFGDMDDQNSEVAQMHKHFKPKAYMAEEGTKPRVFYIE